MASAKQRARRPKYKSEISTSDHHKVTQDDSVTSDSDDNDDNSSNSSNNCTDNAFAIASYRANHSNAKRSLHCISKSHNAPTHRCQSQIQRRGITHTSQLSRTQCRSNIMMALSRLHEAVNVFNTEHEQEQSDMTSTQSDCTNSNSSDEQQCEVSCGSTTATAKVMETLQHINLRSQSNTSNATCQNDYIHSVHIPVHVFDQPSVYMCYAPHTAHVASQSVQQQTVRNENVGIAYVLSNGTCGVYFGADHSCLQLFHYFINKRQQTKGDSKQYANLSDQQASLIKSSQLPPQQKHPRLLFLMYVNTNGKAFIVSSCTLRKPEKKQRRLSNDKECQEKKMSRLNIQQCTQMQESIVSSVEHYIPYTIKSNSKQSIQGQQQRQCERSEKLTQKMQCKESEIINRQTLHFIIPAYLQKKFEVLAQALPVLENFIKYMQQRNNANIHDNEQQNEMIIDNLFACKNIKINLQPTRWQSSILLCEQIITRKAASVADERIHYRVHNMGFGEVVRVVNSITDASNCAVEEKLRHSYQFSSPASFWRIPYVALVTVDDQQCCSTSSTDGDDKKNVMCNYTFTLANKLDRFEQAFVQLNKR